MTAGQGTKELIEDFIEHQVIRRGLDERTEKAYRLDLEHFYRWLEQEENGREWTSLADRADARQERYRKGFHAAEVKKYQDHLSRDKGLRPSTIARKSRVIGYHLEYLAGRGILPGGLSAHPSFWPKSISARQAPSDPLQGTMQEQMKIEESTHRALSKVEIDGIFQALQREYEELDSDFRRRICLRDLVMLGLLFYHGIEVSELLRIQVSDYDRKAFVLSIRRKRGKAEAVHLYSRALRERMEGWLDEHVYFEREEEYRDRMFLSKLGRPLSMKMVINIFDKYRVMAGIETTYTPKDLKNSMERYARELVVERCS